MKTTKRKPAKNYIDVPVHVPRSLHRRAAMMAERDGVSLNEWVNYALIERMAMVTAFDPLPAKKAKGGK